MQSTQSLITFERQDDRIILQPHGEIDLSNSSVLRQHILNALNLVNEVLVDFSDVDYIDSSAIAALVEGLQFAQEHDKRFALLTPSERVRSILELARLDKVFTILNGHARTD